MQFKNCKVWLPLSLASAPPATSGSQLRCELVTSSPGSRGSHLEGIYSPEMAFFATNAYILCICGAPYG